MRPASHASGHGAVSVPADLFRVDPVELLADLAEAAGRLVGRLLRRLR